MNAHVNEVQDGGEDGKAQPAKGKRYSPAQRKEILDYAKDHRVSAAAHKFGVTETTIYEWRRMLKRRGADNGDGGQAGEDAVVGEDEDRNEVRDRKILAMWKQHPGYGPSQIRNQP